MASSLFYTIALILCARLGNAEVTTSPLYEDILSSAVEDCFGGGVGSGGYTTIGGSEGDVQGGPSYFTVTVSEGSTEVLTKTGAAVTVYNTPPPAAATSYTEVTHIVTVIANAKNTAEPKAAAAGSL